MKSEGVMDDENGDDDGDGSEEDWLVQSLQSETGSLFGDEHWCISQWAICDFYRNERFVIFQKEVRVQWEGWREIKLYR